MLASIADGKLTLTFQGNQHGTATITVTATDSADATVSDTLTVDVAAVNDPPVALADSDQTDEDVAVTINVAANDTDIDGTVDPATVFIVDQPGHGSVAVGVDGTITYTPAANYHGNDSFTYKVRDDGGAESNAATVSVTIVSVNDPPVAADDQLSTGEGQAATVEVTFNDTDVDGTIDPATVAIVDQPSHGSVTVGNDGTITYTPAPGYLGPDRFSYVVQDNEGAESNAADVSVLVESANLTRRSRPTTRTPSTPAPR